MQIGEKIEELRKDRNLTQTELAEALMLKQDIISRIEKGRREISNSELVVISKFFGVSADYLLGISDVKTSDTDIKAICDYTGLDEAIIQKLNFQQYVLTSQSKRHLHISDRLTNLRLYIIDTFLNQIFFSSNKSLFYSLDEYINLVEELQEICSDIQNINDFESFAKIYRNFDSDRDKADLKKYQMKKCLDEFISILTNPYDDILKEINNKMYDKNSKLWDSEAEEYNGKN